MSEMSIEERLARLEERLGFDTKGKSQALSAATAEFARTRDIAAAHKLLDQVDRIASDDPERFATATIPVPTITITITLK
jgi:hypothetical protein